MPSLPHTPSSIRHAAAISAANDDGVVASHGKRILATLSALMAFASISTDPERAGAVSALIGAIQYGTGILGSALVGAFANGTPAPMGYVIGVLAVAGQLSSLASPRHA